jgi:hypothetical protein
LTKLHALTFAGLCLGLTACQSLTISQYRISGATSHRERVEALLTKFASHESLQAVNQAEARPELNERAAFAWYQNPLLPGIELMAFDLNETVETRLVEHRNLFANPSGRFDSLEQKLLHEFHSAFGTEVRFRTEAGRVAW